MTEERIIPASELPLLQRRTQNNTSDIFLFVFYSL